MQDKTERRIIVAIVLAVFLALTIWGGILTETADSANPTKTETSIKSERPQFLIHHFVSETEWDYKEKWGITIPQWIERLGYCKAEQIVKRNGKIHKGDWIEIPIYKKSFTGTASYYGYETSGTTATGKTWNPENTLVASIFLPKSPSISRQTIIDITNTENGRTIQEVEVQDSGPYAYDVENGIKKPRALDLSLGLKKKLGCSDLCKVRYTIKYIPPKYNLLS